MLHLILLHIGVSVWARVWVCMRACICMDVYIFVFRIFLTSFSADEENTHTVETKPSKWVLLHKTVPAVILNVRIETKSRDYKINTK